MSHSSAQSLPIIIAGMHRSGTSLTASILQAAGVHIGEQLVGAGTGNPRGHFEDVDFWSLHQDILISQGITTEGWTTQTDVPVPQQFLERIEQLCDYRRSRWPIWGWKEPRTTLFLQFWKAYLPEARFILVYRSPWEVVDSLFTRGDQAFIHNPKLAIEIWTAYNQAILDFTQQNSDRSLLVHVNSLAHDENTLISKVNEKFGLELVQIKDKIFHKDEMHQQIASTHRPNLLAHCFPSALEIYQRLEEKADLFSPTAFNYNPKGIPLDYQNWAFQDWRSSSRLKAVLEYVEAQAQLTQSELHAIRTELNVTYTALQETRSELSDTYTALQKSRSELSDTYTALQESRTEANKLYTDSKRFYEELQSTHAELEYSKQVIAAMESSKFWALRNRWLKLKEFFSKLPSVTAVKNSRGLEHEQSEIGNGYR